MWIFVLIVIITTVSIIGTHLMAKLNPDQSWYPVYALILADSFILGCGFLR